MKIYHGYADSESVVVEDLSDGALNNLTHYVRHSPDGFLWGYEGSGPAELARCLLIDALGSAAWEEGEVNRAGESLNGPFTVYGDISNLVEQLYQSYKSQVIARLDRGTDWTLSQNSILTWVRQAADLKGITFDEPLGAPA